MWALMILLSFYYCFFSFSISHIDFAKNNPQFCNGGGEMPTRIARRQLVSAAEKAKILMIVKERDYHMNSVMDHEFSDLVLKVRQATLHAENRTSCHLKPLCNKTLRK